MRKNWKLLLAMLAMLGLLATACGAAEDAADVAGDAVDAAGDAADEAADAAGDAVDEAADAAGDAVDEAMGDDEGEMMEGLTVGLTYDLLGRGDQSFNDSAAAGADKAKAELGATVNELTPTDASARETDLQLQAENSGLVIGVGFSFAEGAAKVAANNPDVKIAVIDDAMMNFDTGEPVAPNATGLVFAEEQGSYLVGVAAGLKTESNVIGFIGGVSGIGLIEKFEAGFTAGVKSVNPDAEVKVSYISEFPDFAGFESPDRGREIASAMYEEGADVIYAAAGLSGTGMFEAAKAHSEASGSKVWGIGVDSDQYNTVDSSLSEYVLTSMLKRVDVAVYNVTEDVMKGNFTAGEVRYDLAAEGVGYSTTGGFVDDIVDQLEAAKADVISGAVEVPTAP